MLRNFLLISIISAQFFYSLRARDWQLMHFFAAQIDSIAARCDHWAPINICIIVTILRGCQGCYVLYLPWLHSHYEIIIGWNIPYTYWWHWLPFLCVAAYLCLRSFRHPFYPQVILKIQRGEKCQAFYLSSFALWGPGGDSSRILLSADNSYTEDTSSLSCRLELFQSTLILRRCRPDRRSTWWERWAGGVSLPTPALWTTSRYKPSFCCVSISVSVLVSVFYGNLKTSRGNFFLAA